MIDIQFQEFNNIFMEVSSEMHICIASLNLRDLISAFNKEKLINLVRHDFLLWSLWTRKSIINYIMDVSSCEYFSNLDGISDLSKKIGRNYLKTYCLSNGVLTFEVIITIACDNWNH